MPDFGATLMPTPERPPHAVRDAAAHGPEARLRTDRNPHRRSAMIRSMALLRYRMSRGRQASGNPLPDAVRQDTRKHTKHCLPPEPEAVEAYLAAPTAAASRSRRVRTRA